MLVEVQLHAHSGNVVEWDRFLCELVDSGMSVRSLWERTKRRLVSNAHFIKCGESCVPSRVSESPGRVLCGSAFCIGQYLQYLISLNIQ